MTHKQFLDEENYARHIVLAKPLSALPILNPSGRTRLKSNLSQGLTAYDVRLLQNSTYSVLTVTTYRRKHTSAVLPRHAIHFNKRRTYHQLIPQS
jgi:hypothetical protein